MHLSEASISQRLGRHGKTLVANSVRPHVAARPATQTPDVGAVGARLEALSGTVTLHHRRPHGAKTNIDHLVVSPDGVWVVDAEQFEGSIGIRGGLFKLNERLISAGCDRTKLVEAVLAHVEAVREQAADVLHSFGTNVRGALCFTGADWGWLQGCFAVMDVLVAKPKQLTKLIHKAGALQPNRVRLLAGELAAILPAADESTLLPDGEITVREDVRRASGGCA